MEKSSPLLTQKNIHLDLQRHVSTAPVKHFKVNINFPLNATDLNLYCFFNSLLSYSYKKKDIPTTCSKKFFGNWDSISTGSNMSQGSIVTTGAAETNIVKITSKQRKHKVKTHPLKKCFCLV